MYNKQHIKSSYYAGGMVIQLTDAAGNILPNCWQIVSLNGTQNNWNSQNHTYNVSANYPDMYLSFFPWNLDNSGAVVWYDDMSVSFNSGNVQAPDQLNIATYYPHGSVMPGMNYNTSYTYKYGYQGQFAEMDAESNESFFELRNYNALLGRFSTTDPYGQYFSPYLAMGNSHPNMIDPDGGWSWTGALIGAGVGAATGVATGMIISGITHSSGKQYRNQMWGSIGVGAALGLLGGGGLSVSVSTSAGIIAIGAANFPKGEDPNKLCPMNFDKTRRFHVKLPRFEIERHYKMVTKSKIIRIIKGGGAPNSYGPYRINIPGYRAAQWTVWSDQFSQPNGFSLLSNTGIEFGNAVGDFNVSFPTKSPPLRLTLNVSLLSGSVDKDKWEVYVTKTYKTRKSNGIKIRFSGWK